MKNRILELCLCKGIESVKEFSEDAHIPLEEAVALINKDDNVIIKPESIDKCLKYFNCSYNYFVCLVD